MPGFIRSVILVKISVFSRCLLGNSYFIFSNYISCFYFADKYRFRLFDYGNTVSAVNVRTAGGSPDQSDFVARHFGIAHHENQKRCRYRHIKTACGRKPGGFASSLIQVVFAGTSAEIWKSGAAARNSSLVPIPNSDGPMYTEFRVPK